MSRIRAQLKVPADGRRAVLDAAETLFAQHGYFGASMRDITALAAVPHGLATYHFSSKDDLFRQVVARRAPTLLEVLRRGLHEASIAIRQMSASEPDSERARAVITAYVGAHVRFAAESDEHACYMRLTQQLIAIGKRRELTIELAEAYQPIAEAYLGALAAACPWMSMDGIHRRFYMMRLLLAGVLVDVEAAEAIGESEAIVHRVGLFCSASFSERMDDRERALRRKALVSRSRKQP